MAGETSALEGSVTIGGTTVAKTTIVAFGVGILLGMLLKA